MTNKWIPLRKALGIYRVGNVLDQITTEVTTAAKIIESRFSKTFIQCLSPELRTEYDGWVFTREVLATRFRLEVCNEIDEIAIAGRETKLFLQALKGGINPFVEFFMAFEVGELTIWHRIASVVTNFVHTKNQGIFVPKKLAKWKKVIGRLLESRVQDLIFELKYEKICPDLKAESRTKTKTKTEASNIHLPVKEKKNKMTYSDYSELQEGWNTSVALR